MLRRTVGILLLIAVTVAPVRAQVTLTTVVQDLDTYDLGENRWDLATSFHMHSWHSLLVRFVAQKPR